MGYQPKHGGGGPGAAGGGGDLLPRLHSPRVAGGGYMTRRANSFKRCPGGEIELQIGSPRSPRTECVGSPPAEPSEASSSSTYASIGSAAGGGGGGLHHQQHLRFRLFKRPGSSGGAGEVVLGLGIRERRKLGNLLFFAFCGVCLILGVAKIWAGGWFGLPGDDLQDQQHVTFEESCIFALNVGVHFSSYHQYMVPTNAVAHQPRGLKD